LYEIGPADAEESRIGFTGNGFGEQGFAGARRANHQDTLGNAATQSLEFLGIFEELDQLRNFFYSFINARDVFKGRFIPLFGKKPGLAFAETERAFARHLDLANEEEINEQSDDHKRQHADGHAPE